MSARLAEVKFVHKILPILVVSLGLSVFCGTKVANATAINEIAEVQNCKARHKNRLDYSQCLDSVLLKLDRDIQTWENNVEFKLKELSNVSGRGDALIVFNKSSKQFHTYRQTNCRWQYLAKLPDVSSAAVMVKECKIDMAKERINNLVQLSELEF